MHYEVVHESTAFHVEIREAGPDLFEVTIDGGEVVRVDARRTGGTVYSLLIGSRQVEASVDFTDEGDLDVHVGTSAFDFKVVDERRKLLVGGGVSTVTGRQELRAQMPGRIVKLLVRVGDEVEENQGLIVIEAMKMENELQSPIAGVVTEISVAEGESVETNAPLVVVEPPADGE